MFRKMAFHLCPPFVPLILGDTKFFRKFVDLGTKYLMMGDKNTKGAAIPRGLVAPGVNK